MRDWRAYVRERLHLHGVKPDNERDVVDDLAVLLDEAYQDARSRGLSEADAVVAAEAHITDWDGLSRHVGQSRRLRQPMLARLEARSADAALGGDRRAGVLTGLLQDLRAAVRLRRHGGYFAFATATLAVAVGVNLIVFTVVNALWLRPLPFRDADRLVAITGMPFVSVNAPVLRRFDAIAGQVLTTDAAAGLRPRLTLDHVAGELETVGVTPGFFGLFGLAVQGRDFVPDDDRVGADPVAIISDALWSRAFGRRAEVIGSEVAASPVPIRIIGVAPRDFRGARRGDQTDVWIPSRLVPRLAVSPGASPFPANTSVTLEPFARLKPGDSAASVLQQLSETVGAPTLESISIVPLADVFGSPVSRSIVIREGNVFGVVAGLALLVLLGGCATLMALVLVHYERRRRDQAVKVALGASRLRLTRELLLELALLAIAGTFGAVLVATWGLAAIPSLSLPGGVDLGRLDLSMDWRVLTTAVVTTVVTLVVAAWMPVSRFTRARLAGELIAGPATTASVSSHRIRQTLLALHVSSAIVVLVAAGLFVRAVVHGFSAGPGFDPDRTAFVSVTVSSSSRDFASPEAWLAAGVARNVRLMEALQSLPGVEAVAMGTPPIAPEHARAVLTPRTLDTADSRHQLRVGTAFGGPGLLTALGVPLLAGRSLGAADAATRPAPAVMTASLARILWPTEDPLGQVVSVGGGRTGGRFEVVGIAGDFAYGSLNQPAAGVIVTVPQSGGGNQPQFVIRASSPGSLVESIHELVKAVVPEATALTIETGTTILERDLGRQRLGAWFFSGFGLAALALGVGGVFGLVAYLAESRRREFAVRLALGASPRDLVQHGLRAALVPVTFGVIGGLIAAAFVARMFTSLLTGLSALDPLTYLAVGVTMLGCAALAGLGAAWRLRRMVPTDALRTE